MLLRLFAGVGTTAFMMLLVWMQMRAAGRVGWLSVEQIVPSGYRGLTFDRHYGMPLDFCIVAPLVGWAIFYHMPQWTLRSAGWVALVTLVVTVALVIFW